MGHMNVRSFRIPIVFLLSWVMVAPLRAIQWFPLGPFGGDARSFAPDPLDPKHVYLGTATGWVYDSRDGGATWKRVAQIDSRDDLVIDHILADPSQPDRLIVGAFSVDRPDGGVWISEDGGRTFYDQVQMHGQSVLSLARSASNPSEIVAGTLRGVFQSDDNGRHWHPISPAESTEIHEVESIAIDPVNPEVIYAGTWHLPWKTTDGGKHWENIKRGIIDDSDVFSIIVDPVNPKLVYASACSGIYKSSDAAMEFHKIEGIPSTARRTRKLAQDPQHLGTVYAGTTEGLYRTLDAGEHWDRMTGPDLIVNDVYVDPSNDQHILLATDRGGVMASEDGATSFRASNAGFSARQVTSYAAKVDTPSTLYVGVVNDKLTGGVFMSEDGGLRWHQESAGLDGRDVFALTESPAGTLLAGTSHGIFRLGDGAWTDTGLVAQTAAAPQAPVAKPVPVKKKPAHMTKAQAAKSRAAAAKRKPAVAARAVPPAPAGTHLDTQVFALVSSGSSVFAGTSHGLLRSDDDGQMWHPAPTLALPEVRFVAVERSTILAGGLKSLYLSLDGGAKWHEVALPEGLTQIAALALDDQDHLWIGGREGLFLSPDEGGTWTQLPKLNLRQIDGIYFDTAGARMLVTTLDAPFVFSVHMGDEKVVYFDTGWKLRFARPVGDHLVGATLYDGMVIQPRMVDSPDKPASLSVAKPAGAASVPVEAKASQP